MNLKILSWNVRGLNDCRKRSIVKNLLREWKYDVICLQETKLTGLDRQMVVTCGVVFLWIGWL